MHPLFHPLYIDFCTYFNGNRDYFECHEVLEEYWKEIAPAQKRHPLVGYIQLATGMYHYRRGNVAGAKRMLANAHRILNAPHSEIAFFEKVDVAHILAKIEGYLHAIEHNLPFTPFDLIMTDASLRAIVNSAIEALPESDPHYILHKHTLRDRSDVIALRKQNLHARR